MYSEAHDFRIEVGYKNSANDPTVKKLGVQLKRNFSLSMKNMEIVRVYLLRINARPQQVQQIANEVLTDRIICKNTVNALWTQDYDFIIERRFRPGVTDNEAKTCREQIGLLLGRKLRDEELVQTAMMYVLKSAPQADVEKFSKIVANPLIHETTNFPKGTYPRVSFKSALHRVPPTETVNLQEVLDGDVQAAMQKTGLSMWRLLALPVTELKTLGLKKRQAKDDDLRKLSIKMTLALSPQELIVFRDYLEKPAVKKKRLAVGLAGPTDAELEAFAQTQSEHCKHKIFNATIDYKKETIKSVYKTYIRGATESLARKRPDMVSVFKDNAGIISFNSEQYVCFKVETHNTPSALDPFGGAETGIVGVNRDVLGAGLGAKPIANTNVFCLADPFHKGEIPPSVLHPWRIFECVREGVESGGNKSGIPTVNGAYVFDERFLGRPLVFCGTIGMMPKKAAGKDTAQKGAKPGDKIVVVGGRIGKDGIHGATFSSAELDESSPATAVQMGDPITQKKMSDALLEARDRGLMESITDNGAGGLSSSIGEMAIQAGGCDFDVAKAPLKYPGLAPWEILLSEAQERMSVAVSQANLDAFMALMKHRCVEATVLGEFTNTGLFHVRYNTHTIAYLDLEFLHDGLPPLRLEAAQPEPFVPAKRKNIDVKKALPILLADLSVCSKEYTIRQYDHEVQAQTIIKPLVGIERDGPSDAAVLKPIHSSWKGLVISCGISPTLGDHDSYAMAQASLDEAVRNAIAVGADPKSIVVLDNFCWPDPIFDPKSNADGKQKLGKLIEACRGLYDAAIAFEMPFISGKDSMKNDFRYEKDGATKKISIPPTVLISAMGTMPDIRQAITMDAKCAGDLVYVIGKTADHLLGSRFEAHFGAQSQVPRVDVPAAKKTYEVVHEAIKAGLIASCHDCSDGGLAVALAESAFAGGLGMSIELSKVLQEADLTDSVVLFSETPSRFVITVPKLKQKALEQAIKTIPFSLVGETTKDQFLRIKGKEGVSRWSLKELKAAWQQPFGESDG